MSQPFPVRRRLPSTVGVLLTVVLVVLVAPSAGLAATPPLSGDGRLTVTLPNPDDPSGDPLAGVDVLLTAVSDGSVLGEVAATTDDTGSVVFGDLPVSDGTVVVEWIVEARALVTAVDPNGCETSSGWAASDVVESGLDVSLSLTVQAIIETTCPDDGPPPPDGVVNDAILTVTVTDDAGHVAGASVSIFASVADGGLIFKAGEMTNEDGLVTVGGVPRPDVDGPVVTWQVRVSAWAESPSPVDGCLWTRMGWGETDLDASPGTTAIAIELTWEDASAVCDPPPDESPVLRGTVLDNSGAPFQAEVASLLQTRLDGATYRTEFSVDASGAFAVPVHAWGTASDPSALVVHVQSGITRTEVDGDCLLQYALMTESAITVALADGQTLPGIEMIAWEQEVSGGCGSTDTPIPGDSSEGGSPVTGPGGPSITLPPTDIGSRDATGNDRTDSTTLAAVLLATLAGMALVSASLARARRSIDR